MATGNIIQSLYIQYRRCATASLADLNTTTCVVLCFFPQNKTIFEILRRSIAWYWYWHEAFISEVKISHNGHSLFRVGTVTAIQNNGEKLFWGRGSNSRPFIPQWRTTILTAFFQLYQHPGKAAAWYDHPKTCLVRSPLYDQVWPWPSVRLILYQTTLARLLGLQHNATVPRWDWFFSSDMVRNSI